MSEHELWNELGNLYFMSGAYNQAANAYQRSIQLDAGFGRPYSNLALTYVQQGKFEEAIDLYRRSIELLAENQEKAVSWNRLGTVYRHLKDYSKAVRAFQEADELDPQSLADFPVTLEARAEPSQIPPSVLDEPIPTEEQTELADAGTSGTESKPDETQLEWWDVDDTRLAAAMQPGAADPALRDGSNESWTPADLSQYQQDVSQMPETGSLTTSGDAGFEEDFENYPPLDPAPQIDMWDPDNEDLSTWLPLPEEEPLDLDELVIPPFLEQMEPVPEPDPDWGEASSYDVLNSLDSGPFEPAWAGAPAGVDFAERNDPIPDRPISSQQASEMLEVDIDVQDRPTADLALVPQDLAEPLESATIAEQQAQPQFFPAPTPEGIPAPESTGLEREADEMHEIEKGIARFRRVVQVNPRNAHAWDALGTLFKSAGLYKDAILAYQQAISNDGSKSLYYHHLGLVYACEGRDEDAIGAFQRVIEIDPEYSLAHATLGGYYRKLGLEELAQKHIGKAMKNIFDSENEYNRACLEAICGNADQAIELLGVALKNKQTYVDWILRDPDLDFIRQDPRFKQLISDYTR